MAGVLRQALKATVTAPSPPSPPHTTVADDGSRSARRYPAATSADPEGDHPLTAPPTSSGRLAAVKRAGWGLGDQAFSSLTNFALGIAVARTVTTAEFGAFSLAFATYLLAMGMANALASQPLVVRYSTATEERWRDGTRSATGMALVVGVLSGLGCLVVAVVADGALSRAFLALGIAMPGLLLQDTWRFAFFTRGRGASAFVNDVVWALVLFPVLGVLLHLGLTDVLWLVAAWGVAGMAGGLVGMHQARIVPRPAGALAWWRQHRDQSANFVGEFAAVSGSKQGSVFGIGAVAGLAPVGALRAGEMLLGPLLVLFNGIYLIAVPEAARLLQHSLRRMLTALVALSAALAAAAALAGAVLLALPDSIGEALLGETWALAVPVILPLAVANVLHGAISGSIIGLRALEAANHSFRARLVMSVLAVVLGVGGAAVAGAVGAAWGTVGSALVGTILHWHALRSAARSRHNELASDEAVSP
jgi:O-antigen/teichoic acid export membrane protein